MTTNLESLPATLIRAISIFCEPNDICSLSITCHSIHKDLRISILKPPFSSWRRRVEYVTPVQQIMHLPSFIHDQCYFLRVYLGFDAMEQWGPWTRFYIVSQPGTITNDPTKRIRDDKGNEGTIVKQLPIAWTISKGDDILVEPHQKYFLWSENKVNSIMHVRLEARRILVCDTTTLCLKRNFTRMVKFESQMLRHLHPSEAKFLCIGDYQVPAPFFFTNLFAATLEGSESSTIKNYFGSVTVSTVHVNLLLELKILIKLCEQLLVVPKRSHQVRNEESVLQPDIRIPTSMDTAVFLVRFSGDTIGWIQYQFGDRFFYRLPIVLNTTSIRLVCEFSTDSCTLLLLGTILQENNLVWKLITPTKCVDHEQNEEDSFVVEYLFELEPNTASCFIHVQHLPNAVKCSIKTMSVSLTFEKDGTDIANYLPLVMKRFITPYSYEDVDTSRLSSLHRSVQIFSGAVLASAFLDPNGRDYKVVTKYLEDEGFSTTLQGLGCLVDMVCAAFWI